MNKIGILDIGLGNLSSVFNAIYENGFDPKLVSESANLSELTHLILPGVGNFAAGMSSIRSSVGMASALQEFASSGRPMLGICLGMQLFATTGYEGGVTTGLGLIDGEIRRISESPGLRIPHVGWNEVVFQRNHPLFEGIKPERDFYFVHSYCFFPDNPDDILAVTDYGGQIVCAVAHDNLVGLQFHPEKSQGNGLKILENFCAWDGTC